MVDALKMTNKGFDIPSSRFDFAKDLKYGLQGEELVSLFLEQVSNGDFEVKSDRYRNGRMIVETNQNPRAVKDEHGTPVWVSSGINVTTASWWVYIFSPSGAFVVVSVSRLKKYLRLNKQLFNESTKRELGGADNPARGFLLYPEHVRDMMTKKDYDID